MLPDGEAGLRQPLAAEAQDGKFPRPGPEAVVVVVAVDVADGDAPLFAGLAGASGHELLPRDGSNAPPVQRGGRVLEHRSRTARSFPLSGVVWLRATRP